MRRSLVLPTIPETGTLRLLYGGVEIPKGKGWLFDPRSNEIRIDETIQVKYDPNAKFAVQYTRVEPQAIAKGRAKPKK